ncbi:hypothetical protein GOP47_0019072 [Adiantum capillus-veneris]|uniref:Uncharacterized protein n=1 Tax=Adiantum capillus-veneris TaxID=13818 RepID=A0A9D4UED7_ADICA|nr:hypothetical protein GOP47_0019072 [Adiantum capillus-veneris]
MNEAYFQATLEVIVSTQVGSTSQIHLLALRLDELVGLAIKSHENMSWLALGHGRMSWGRVTGIRAVERKQFGGVEHE